jgi:serine/threonine protein phosphatase PrpC
MSPELQLEIAALSDAGVKRAVNEDSIGTEPRLGLLVLADGMGGYKGGEVASALAVNTILNEFEETLRRKRAEYKEDESGEFGPESLAVQEIVKKSNEIIYNAAKSHPHYKDMGTTIVMAVFYGGNRVSIAHVGDSRLYRFRDDKLELVTLDHTLLQELIARGFYTAEEARASMNKNLVTRALGSDAQVQVDIQEDIALPGDIYLLCSDGLNDMVDDRDIYSTLKRYNDSLDRAVAELVKLANNNGGKDNVSVILARPTKTSTAYGGWIDKIADWFF